MSPTGDVTIMVRLGQQRRRPAWAKLFATFTLSWSFCVFSVLSIHRCSNAACLVGRTREEHNVATSRAHGDRPVKYLFGWSRCEDRIRRPCPPKEVVVGSVRHELLITYIGGGEATVSGGGSPFGV
jgi:hypothetical protein